MKAQPLRMKLREATGNAILDAAESVAAEVGSANASLQAIAERAGTAVGTIYNYFQDKDELFSELYKRRKTEMFDAIDAAAKKHAKEPFAAQLDAFVGAVFAYFDEHHDFLRLALDAEPPRLLMVKRQGGKSPAMRQLEEHAERVVQIGLKEKKLRDDAADLLPVFLVALVRGVLSARAKSDAPFAPERARVVSVFMNGAAR